MKWEDKGRTFQQKSICPENVPVSSSLDQQDWSSGGGVPTCLGARVQEKQNERKMQAWAHQSRKSRCTTRLRGKGDWQKETPEVGAESKSQWREWVEWGILGSGKRVSFWWHAVDEGTTSEGNPPLLLQCQSWDPFQKPACQEGGVFPALIELKQFKCQIIEEWLSKISLNLYAPV